MVCCIRSGVTNDGFDYRGERFGILVGGGPAHHGHTLVRSFVLGLKGGAEPSS